MNTFTKLIIIVALILGAVGGAFVLIKTAPKAKKKRPTRTAYPTRVVTLQPQECPVTIEAAGTIMAAQEINLRARVSGELTSIAPEFIEGGRFSAGETILQIDPTDYRLAREQKSAALAEADYLLKVEKGQSAIAAHEWKLLGNKDATNTDRELALRIPNLKFRQARLEAAQASLEKAELDLQRTTLKAPFNAIVVDRKSVPGSQVGSQDILAVLAGSDEYYIQAAIPVDRLPWMECNPETGSTARILRNSGPPRVGRVIRLESSLEEKGRLARVLISIPHPLEGSHPLLLGEYVQVEISGTPVPDGVIIPRDALHDDQNLWIATPENKLEIRPVSVAWRDTKTVIVTNSVESGEHLILTDFATPIDGMKLMIMTNVPTAKED